MRRGRCLRWADEEELPDRVKKPTTPRDPRAFPDWTGDARRETDTSTGNLESPARAQIPDRSAPYNFTALNGLERYSAPNAADRPEGGAFREHDPQAEVNGLSPQTVYRATTPDASAGTQSNGKGGYYAGKRSTATVSSGDDPHIVSRDADLDPCFGVHHHHHLCSPWGTRKPDTRNLQPQHAMRPAVWCSHPS